MSTTKDSSMSRAHSLTNRGTLLMNNVTGTGNKSDPVILQQALDALQQGTDLFEQASKDIKDHGAITTVNLLIIQNRKQIKDITRRLNTLKIQERQRQMNLEKAQALNHSPKSFGTMNRATGARDPPKVGGTKVESQGEGDPGRTVMHKPDSALHSGPAIDAEKRPRRRRMGPGMSMMGSSMFGSTVPGQKDTSQLPTSQTPLASPVAASRKTWEFTTETYAVRSSPANFRAGDSSESHRCAALFNQKHLPDVTRSLSQSPENRFSRGLGDRSTAPSTVASSVYDGSVYTSGYGHSQGSRSSGSSTFGAFDGEDSFVYFTHPLGSSDPFARFWNVLETAMDQISNPVAFASIPIDLPQVVDPIHQAIGKRHRRKHKEKNGKGKHRDKEGSKENRDRRHGHRVDKGSGRGRDDGAASELSSSDSFCVISKDGFRDDTSTRSSKSSVAETSLKHSNSTLHASAQLSSSALTVSGKSPEELALENVNLRRSLDALSLRTQALEQELETYKKHSDQRQELMKSVVLGVRREAQKAIIQNQMLGSLYAEAGDKEHERGSSSASRMSSPLRHTVKLRDQLDIGNSLPEQRIKTPSISADEDPFAMDGNRDDDPLENFQGGRAPDTESDVPDTASLQRRLQEMEAENQVLQIENQRSRSHLQKYRDRFERMKVSSKAKKEAKLTTGGIQRTSDLPTLGEEGE